ncbi:MAG: NfeD family protein [Dehalococcoidia bacterium]|nr:NfeD family protein [Dehalococcoidia bacterium]
MEFLDSWLWLIFIVAGLFLAILELLIGVDTGLDLVIMGSAFVIGGLVTWPADSWVLTAVIVSLLSLAYVAFGRRYIHRRMLVKEERTNIDALIGMQGTVLKAISENVDGLVKVGHEEWRARAEGQIAEGIGIEVTGISGVTLLVTKSERSS